MRSFYSYELCTWRKLFEVLFELTTSTIRK